MNALKYFMVLFCAVCHKEIVNHNDKNRVFGRSSFKVSDELKTLDFNVETLESSHICRKCISLLKKRRGIINNLRNVNEVLRQLYRDESSNSKRKDGPCRTESPDSAAKRLALEDPSNNNAPSSPIDCDINSLPLPFQPQNSTPVKHGLQEMQALPDPVSPLGCEQEPQKENKKTSVEVKVEWPSKTKINTLPESLESLGKMLCRGTYKQIASAVWRNPILKKYIQQLLLQEIDRECSTLCGFEKDSKGKKTLPACCLRTPNKKDLAEFSFKKLNAELETKAPLLSAVLWTASLRKSKRESEDGFWEQSLGMAAAVVLKNRCPQLNALQLINTIIIYHSGLAGILYRLGSLRITTSHTLYYKKMDEFGVNFNEAIKRKVSDENKRLQRKHDEVSASSANESSPVDMAMESTQPQSNQEIVCSQPIDAPITDTAAYSTHPIHVATPTIHEPLLQAIPQRETAECAASSNEATNNDIVVLTPDKGRKLVFDNFDIRQKVHNMTEDHQNTDLHWVTHIAVENRVHGNHLSREKPSDLDILSVENGRFLPNHYEHHLQRENYITLTERIIVELQCLNFLRPCVVRHIPHQYSQEMSQNTEMTFLGMLYHNENDADGIKDVLGALHEYVPYYTDGDASDRVYSGQGLVADQLSVERGVNALFQISNGFDAEERMEGLHLEIADWHAGNKFLKLCFKNFYSGSSSIDKCTLYSDRNLINRRNVKADVDGAVNPCRKFVDLEVKARITAAAMQVLGINSTCDEPDSSVLAPEIKEAHVPQQKAYLRKIAALVVDKFVLRTEKNEALLQKIFIAQEIEQSKERNQTQDGRFICRFPGCDKTFAFNGKTKRDHELSSHNLPPYQDEVQLSSELPSESTSDSSKEFDDMFNYQCSFLQYTMIIMNFFDAIKEGDGNRVMRCWKFQLPYLRNDAGSTKYALEALHLLFQVNTILSPLDAHRLIWNRFACNKSGFGNNIPLDLSLEFINRLMKEIVRKLGHNATNHQTIDRYCRAVNVTKVVMENFDRESSIIKRSGRHYQKCNDSDLQKVVNELVAQHAFSWTPGRKYSHYQNCESSILDRFDLQDMFKWINKHKKNILLSKHAR